MTLGEKVFWAVVAASSVAAGFYGYHRFKLIRPDLFDDTRPAQISEAERAERIRDYQRKGDALTRAANRTPVVRAPGPGEQCANGVVIRIETRDGNVSAKAVREIGRPVHCPALQ